MWLPLLAVLIGLTWAGWHEYQKLEAYRAWAQHFDRSKYDIYAVIGQKGDLLTWGRPTRQGPQQVSTFSLQEVQAIRFLVSDRPTDWEAPDAQGQSIALEFVLRDSTESIRIPFTEAKLAVAWGKHLQQNLIQSQSGLPGVEDGSRPNS
jgi:hypothetical protein